MKKTLKIISSVFLTALIVYNPLNFYASTSMNDVQEETGIEANTEILEKDIEILDPTNFVPKYLEEKHDEFVTTNAESKISIPNNSKSEIKIEANNFTLSLEIPTSSDTLAEKNLDTIIYREEEKTLAVQVSEAGVREIISIHDKDTEEEFEIGFNFEEGAYFKFATDPDGNEDGSILVYNLENEIIGAVDKPWAIDANGQEVTTYYEINDNKIVQIVKHSMNESITYPVIADPYYIYSYFDSGRWINRGGMTSLSLVPNWSTRTIIGIGPSWAIRNASWESVKKDFYWDNRWYNTSGLYDQYVCHFDFAGFKSEFNLEPSRPSVGYWSTVWAKCNP